MISPDLLLRLAESGNSAVVLKWLERQDLSRPGYGADLPSRIDSIKAISQTVSHSVFAPVATPKFDIAPGISLRLEVKSG
ncbi:MAG TPA: hypothetical protein PKV86_15765, partial [Syntrophobacteraceae bacterium]|nr:hypothetical protein [Syntrophobacteraceae bacterium]